MFCLLQKREGQDFIAEMPLIKPCKEGVGSLQHTFPKVVSACFSCRANTSCLVALASYFFPTHLFFQLNFVTDFNMKIMNRTLLFFLLARCQQILKDTDFNTSHHQINRTISKTTVSSLSNSTPVFSTTTSRATYDNAYFYIVFVMVFYSVLALTLFKCFAGSDEAKKDPHEEFTGSGQTSTQTFNAGHMAEKFYFEEESSL